MLRQLPKLEDPNVLIGPEHHSDAGAYRIGENLALVQTVDFFPPLTNDAYLYGQIAAANSLSDVYAMGGRPITALNIVGFPDDELPLEMLNEILRGGAEKAREAGASILGGHSVRDVEIKYGLSVTGLVDPAKMLSNGGARAGDVLLLTKPIGTGAMTAAYQKDKIDARIWDACTTMMTTLNRAAAEAMVAAGAHASTDITGYGLLGHGSEMADASGVTLEIEAATVPQLEGAMDLYKAGFITRAVSTNLSYLEPIIKGDKDVAKPMLQMLVDAQTSGGLLISIPEDRVEAFGEAMKAAGGDSGWAKMGRVTERGEKSVSIV